MPLAITATADVSNDKADNTISVSADKGTQTAEADLTEISACSDAYDGKLPTAEKKFHRDAYLQQQNRQINAVKLQTSVQSKNFTEKCKATVSVPKVEINKGCTPGKAEIKMKRPSELAVSARRLKLMPERVRTVKPEEEERRKKSTRTGDHSRGIRPSSPPSSWTIRKCNRPIQRPRRQKPPLHREKPKRKLLKPRNRHHTLMPTSTEFQRKVNTVRIGKRRQNFIFVRL